MTPRDLRARRLAVGLTQSSLGAAVGVDRKTVVRWESGEWRPRDSHLIRLARVLGIPLRDMATWEAVRAAPTVCGEPTASGEPCRRIRYWCEHRSAACG